MIITFTRRK